ncbi:hypothetical protein M885DRAFT_524453, partial [Pelagophyceae sp. CCMP2097]
MRPLSGLAAQAILAHPKTNDPLFRTIEEVHERLGCQWGHILDAGTGGHSLKWLATLPTPSVQRITAVSADVSSGEGKGAHELRGKLDASRGDVLVEGAWCTLNREPIVEAGSVDTIVCDYLIGSMDGFTPFEQDSLLETLVPRLSPHGLIHVVGLNPVYALLGETGYQKLSGGEQVVVDAARCRDACILLAAHRPYREFPASWVVRQLEKNGLQVVLPWKSFGVVWKLETVQRQLDVARRKLPHFGDATLSAAMKLQLDAISDRARELIPAGGIIYSHDY